MLLSNCTLCSRIHSNLKTIKIQYPTYHCGPVSGSGNIKSDICIIGLAPGLHGANKTGIPFTSDFSGNIIREILDEIKLTDVFITNVVRCYPQNNMPLSSEKNNCQKYNFEELSSLVNLRVIITLGEVAYRQILKLYKIPIKNNKFKHNNITKLNSKLYLISSYHCSKLNVNTRKINKNMLKNVFLRAKNISTNG